MPAPYTLRFNDDHGNLPSTRFELETGSLTGIIPAGGSATIRTAGLGPATVNGWAELTAPASVGGSVIYSQKNRTCRRYRRGRRPSEPPASQHFFLPFDNTNKASTGVAFTNPGAAPANNIQITFHYSDGTRRKLSCLHWPAATMRRSCFPVPACREEGCSRSHLRRGPPHRGIPREFDRSVHSLGWRARPAPTATVLTRTLAHAADGQYFQDHRSSDQRRLCAGVRTHCVSTTTTATYPLQVSHWTPGRIR